MVRPEWRVVLAGTVAGAVATVPMSAVLLAAGAAGLTGRQPPARIVDRGFAAAGIEASSAVRTSSAVVAHVAFGAAVGALYGLGLGAGHAVSRPAPLAGGVAYALLVYTASYAGWIPALDILPSPLHDRRGRQASIIVAHAVFGAALAALVQRLLPGRRHTRVGTGRARDERIIKSRSVTDSSVRT